MSNASNLSNQTVFGCNTKNFMIEDGGVEILLFFVLFLVSESTRRLGKNALDKVGAIDAFGRITISFGRI